ncbi:hypothetical protein V6N11_064870 [Hibiscus sabdariffa]|uniref:Uncharacterized protein n=1 Tax=Hibiscus sabdariffa TaxID=183260 RepID=A0ABR2SJ31_9ROSI
MRRGIAQLDSSDTILAQISALTNMVKNMQRQPNTREVKYIQPEMEKAPELLIAEPEQQPQSATVTATRISKPAKAVELA